MKRHLNTLFVTSQGAYVHRDNDNVVVNIEREERVRLPIHTLGSIVCFGNVLCSPPLLGHCAENRVSVSFLTEHGRFLARVQGPSHGNVLLRRQQYRLADNEDATRQIASWIVGAKVASSRTQLRRFVRDHHPEGFQPVDSACQKLVEVARRVAGSDSVDAIRGHEGDAARIYFSVFNHLILEKTGAFRFCGRSRRPPLDRINALLSFIYTIVLHDVQAALETVGLDPAVGYLHRDRPGRPGLALDLMEEFRPWLADRVILNLVNREQLTASDFESLESGAVLLNEAGRKTLLTSYQNRKKEDVKHPFLGETVSIGKLFFVQALLFARFVRGDIDAYPPYIPK
jgi:CRISP-associated protein Cas1